MHSLNSSKTNKWSLYYGAQDHSAPHSPEDLMESDWNSIPAIVPGNVEVDLFEAELIKDPKVGNNVYDLRKYETYQWWYQLNFARPEISEGHIAELCFEGIDCIADIWLNGKKIGQTENMFVEHNFEVTDHLNAQK